MKGEESVTGNLVNAKVGKWSFKVAGLAVTVLVQKNKGGSGIIHEKYSR